MIKINIQKTSDEIELLGIDDIILYQIPIDTLTDKYSSENQSCSDWIIHLSQKAFTTEANKAYLYELALIIEENHPLLFEWYTTFVIAETNIFETVLFNHQNKKHEDDFGGLDISCIENDWDQLSDLETKVQLTEVVKENLIEFALPFN